jgi:hypothetical protein
MDIDRVIRHGDDVGVILPGKTASQFRDIQRNLSHDAVAFANPEHGSDPGESVVTPARPLAQPRPMAPHQVGAQRHSALIAVLQQGLAFDARQHVDDTVAVRQFMIARCALKRLHGRGNGRIALFLCALDAVAEGDPVQVVPDTGFAADRTTQDQASGGIDENARPDQHVVTVLPLCADLGHPSALDPGFGECRAQEYAASLCLVQHCQGFPGEGVRIENDSVGARRQRILVPERGIDGPTVIRHLSKTTRHAGFPPGVQTLVDLARERITGAGAPQ